jgi:hypothetical protein
MRGWGRAPICKAFRLDHRLGIRSTRNLAEKGKKGRCGGKRKTREECRDEFLALEFKEELRNECSDCRDMASRL